MNPRSEVRATRPNRGRETIRRLDHHRHSVQGPKALRVCGDHLTAQPKLLKRRALLRQHDHPSRDVETLPVMPQQLRLLALCVETERAAGIRVNRDGHAVHRGTSLPWPPIGSPVTEPRPACPVWASTRSPTAPRPFGGSARLWCRGELPPVSAGGEQADPVGYLPLAAVSRAVEQGEVPVAGQSRNDRRGATVVEIDRIAHTKPPHKGRELR